MAYYVACVSKAGKGGRIVSHHKTKRAAKKKGGFPSIPRGTVLRTQEGSR